jgi:hypothetical protein
VDLGITVAVLAENGGGAPLLIVPRFEAAFLPPSGGKRGAASDEQQGQQQGQQQHQQRGGEPSGQQQLQANGVAESGRQSSCSLAKAGHTLSTQLVTVDSGMLSVETPSLAASVSALTAGGGVGHGLILLVPLVLGLGKVGLEAWLQPGCGALASVGQVYLLLRSTCF